MDAAWGGAGRGVRRAVGRMMCGGAPFVRYTSVQLGAAMTTARLDLRLSIEDKNRITRAAALRGMSLSVFVRDAVLREADMALAADAVVVLSPEESRRFLDALDRPFQPNAKLKKAMEEADRLLTR